MFFSTSTLIVDKPEPTQPKCGHCGLLKQCQSPKLEPWGRGKKSILFVSRSPGAEEDKQGQLMVGNSSHELLKIARAAGINLERDCVLTNALICHPTGTITTEQVHDCRPNLINLINELNPTVIVLLGESAVESLLSYTRKDVGDATRWFGFNIPDQRLNAWICPTYHPAYACRDKTGLISKFMVDHLQTAAELAGTRPWTTVPDYKSQVQLVYEREEIIRRVNWFTRQGDPIAFDYECNRLKPDHPKAQIWSLSISNGRRTIAFPWYTEIESAVSELLLSDCPKIASNAKFEDRWTRAKLGHGVRRWWWDTMQAAHVINGRQGICSVKFQAYALLGQPLWDQHVDTFLTGDGKDKLNQIHKIPLADLLLYNGLDSLVEYHVAQKQSKLFK